MPRFNPMDFPVAFQFPERNTPCLDWWGHIPFGAALVQALRPAAIVELGVFRGDSLCAFAQAAHAIDHECSITGIDLWEPMVGIEQDEETTAELFSFMKRRFPRVILDRRNYNDAVHDHLDGSIDLLHFDGDHRTEAVTSDFEKWLPKLSKNGIMLFHDIALGGNPHIGVDVFWKKIRELYPYFEFYHSWGLGVLAPKGIPPVLESLFASVGTPDEELIQTFYQIMGTRLFVAMFYRRAHGDSILLEAMSNPCLVSEPSNNWPGAAYTATALYK